MCLLQNVSLSTDPKKNVHGHFLRFSCVLTRNGKAYRYVMLDLNFSPSLKTMYIYEYPDEVVNRCRITPLYVTLQEGYVGSITRAEVIEALNRFMLRHYDSYMWDDTRCEQLYLVQCWRKEPKKFHHFKRYWELLNGDGLSQCSVSTESDFLGR